ncbi:hypothetical protein LJC49_00115 [Ruminococcaceae bacterium OttesenSCG-928-I18]|nr:hypothetical protein [Ruminococcaceae bacterium OttesenSCG-928-I18]
MKDQTQIISDFIKGSNGLLKLRPAFVAHDFLPPGKRLGLKEEEYNAGKRGFYCERWFCSETHAVHEQDVPGEGISALEIPGENILLTEALETNGAEILGEAYYKKHGCLDRLAKIFDFGTRLFMHIHQKAENLDADKNPKDEAYHFLDAPMGPHPESFFGVQRFLVENNMQYDYFLPLMQKWEGGEEEILKYSQAFLNVPGEGFFLDSGILHAPGSALTMELQESSDVGAIFQPVVSGYKISKSMLAKDVPQAEIEKYGEELAALHQVDWEASGDPEFFKKRHLFPRKVEETAQGEVFEEWIYYGTPKFSGKRLLLKPGQTFLSKEPGVHNLFIWHGEVDIDGVRMKAGAVDLEHCDDELLVTHERALQGYTVKNTGDEEVALYKFFGPDIHMQTPSTGY